MAPAFFLHTAIAAPLSSLSSPRTHLWITIPGLPSPGPRRFSPEETTLGFRSFSASRLPKRPPVVLPALFSPNPQDQRQRIIALCRLISSLPPSSGRHLSVEDTVTASANLAESLCVCVVSTISQAKHFVHLQPKSNIYLA